MTLAKLFVVPFSIAALLVPAIACAEKADREQKLRMLAKQGSAEGSKDVNVKKLEGDVVITQGTMRITADRAVVKETGGDVFAELFGNASSQITFRQKREGESDFVEASADRAEYDDKTGAIRLFSKVRFKSGGDLVDSEYMQYNTNTEKMELRNQVPGAKPTAATDQGRVMFEVQPRSKTGSPPGDGKLAPAKTN
jgi:lipopolysaccharide export system protein LptA